MIPEDHDSPVSAALTELTRSIQKSEAMPILTGQQQHLWIGDDLEVGAAAVACSACHVSRGDRRCGCLLVHNRMGEGGKLHLQHKAAALCIFLLLYNITLV
jgi:hypothetical protein